MENVVNKLVISIYLKNPLVCFFILMIAICLIFEKKIIGKTGEFYVKQKLKKLSKGEYFVINDLMITAFENTHQIDHVVISKFGIFVIETKHINGYIRGNEYDKKWTVNKKYYINNPIHQNYNHVKALKEVLKTSEDKFIPLVCLTSRCKINIKSKNKVVRINKLLNLILSYKELKNINTIEIYNKLLSLNIKDKLKRKEHVKYAKKIKDDNEIKDKTKCPICGGNLVERTGKYGKFLGCSNYPRCKYTKKGE